MIPLEVLVQDVAGALAAIDASRERYRNFQPGVGPFGEPQLVKRIAAQLASNRAYPGGTCTRRTPDLLIPGEWAAEVKLARPFGDNGRKAENWSVNLLHPYDGNESSVGDCFKLSRYRGSERKAILVIGYEHTPPKIDLLPLIRAFELIAAEVCGFRLSKRVEAGGAGLVHPIHQGFRVFAWQLLGDVGPVPG